MDHPAPTPAPSSPPPVPPEPEPPLPPTRWQRFKRALLGGPKDVQDPLLFQHISLAAFLAWVGLGADGLSSSSYGPEEAFKALGEHQYLAFVATHAVVIIGGVFFHLGRAQEVVEHVRTGLNHDFQTLGTFAVLALFMRAYSLGAGTYTGIEAVSNGLQIMREPRVATAKRTMVYMAVSLALTAGGILVGYLLNDVHPVHGQTMNAVLATRVAGSWSLVGLPAGKAFVVV